MKGLLRANAPKSLKTIFDDRETLGDDPAFAKHLEVTEEQLDVAEQALAEAKGSTSIAIAALVVASLSLLVAIVFGVLSLMHG